MVFNHAYHIGDADKAKAPSCIIKFSYDSSTAMSKMHFGKRLLLLQPEAKGLAFRFDLPKE